MPVPASISDLSTTPALNSPAGSESPALVDDYLRTHAAFIKQVNDAAALKAAEADVVKLTGNQTVAGTKTFSSPIAGSITGNAGSVTNGLYTTDIGVSVQAYDADTAKTDTAQNFTAPQRSAILTDNDGSFDLSAKQNFKCTTAGSVTLTFTNQADGLSGSVIFINASNHTVSAHANTKLTAADLAKLSVTGTYRIDYLSDGTNAYCSVTGAFA